MKCVVWERYGASRLFEMWANLVFKLGWSDGTDLAIQYVTDGLKLAPANATSRREMRFSWPKQSALREKSSLRFGTRLPSAEWIRRPLSRNGHHHWRGGGL